MFWVPQSGDIGMGVSILSYDGNVQFGVITDRGLCPDPERISERFGPEFEKLVLATLMAPWPRDGDLDPGVAAQAVGPRPRQTGRSREGSGPSRIGVRNVERFLHILVHRHRQVLRLEPAR